MRSRDVVGPECPLTGRTVAEELQHAVAMLQTVKVGERDGVRYNDAEFRAYCDGWYFGIARALAVMITTIEARATRYRTLDETDDRRITDHHGATEERFYAQQSGPAAIAEPSGTAGERNRRGARRAPRDHSKRGADVVDVRTRRSSGGHGHR